MIRIPLLCLRVAAMAKQSWEGQALQTVALAKVWGGFKKA
jgi:hypothetical protein